MTSSQSPLPLPPRVPKETKPRTLGSRILVVIGATMFLVLVLGGFLALVGILRRILIWGFFQ